MSAIDNTKTKLIRAARNKGNLRLFALVAALWISVSSFVFWKPLPYTYDSIDGAPQGEAGIDLSLLRLRDCPIPDLSKPHDVVYEVCATGVQMSAEAEVKRDRFWVLFKWAAIVFFVPFAFPFAVACILLLGAAAYQWVSNGYASGSSN